MSLEIGRGIRGLFVEAEAFFRKAKDKRQREIEEMSAEGQAAACVPAALKEAGLPVPDDLFIKAAFSGGMDPIQEAEQLGYKAEITDMSIDEENRLLLAGKPITAPGILVARFDAKSFIFRGAYAP